MFRLDGRTVRPRNAGFAGRRASAWGHPKVSAGFPQALKALPAVSPGPELGPGLVFLLHSSPAALPSAPLVHACALTSHSSPVVPRFALPEPLKPRSPGKEVAAGSGASRLGPGRAPSRFSVAVRPARAHAVGTWRKQAGIRVSRPLGWEGADRFRSTVIPSAGAEDGGRVLSRAEGADMGTRWAGLTRLSHWLLFP